MKYIYPDFYEKFSCYFLVIIISELNFENTEKKQEHGEDICRFSFYHKSVKYTLVDIYTDNDKNITITINIQIGQLRLFTYTEVIFKNK